MKLRSALPIIAALLIPGAVQAQSAKDYPSKPINVVVPFAAGGASDAVTRIATTGMATILGQPLVVENRAGAGGSTGSAFLAKAEPDGYTIGNANPGSHGTSPLLQRSGSYDPAADFTPIAMLGSAVFVLICHPDVPAKSVKELIDYMKANPGKVRYGSAGVGSNVHFIGEYFKQRTGADMEHVSYRGAGPMMTDLLGGRIECTFDSSSKAHIDSGRLRALGVTSAKRDPLYPNLPSLQEAGVSDFDITSWQALVGPKGLPAAMVDKLNKAANEVLKQEKTATSMASLGFRPTPMSPEEAGKIIARDAAMYKKIQQQAKIEMQ